MKIYTCYTESHKILLEKYFLPSAEKFNLEIVIKKFDQDCPSAEYKHDGWLKTMTNKAEYFQQACNENIDQYFLYTDCDVQFFGDPSSTVEEELDGYDIAFQDDVHPHVGRNTYCAGVVACRGSKSVSDLWDIIIKSLYTAKNNYDDQDTLNNLINDSVKHKLLSHKFYTVAQTTKKLWNNDDTEFQIPNDILVHHANWTHGVKNKIKLLELVKQKYYLK